MQLKALFIAVGASLLLVGCNQDTAKVEKPVPKTDLEKNAYSVGVRMGEQLKQVSQEITDVREDFDVDMYLQGVNDTVRGEVQLSDEDVKTLSTNFQKEFRELHRKKQEEKVAANLEKAKAFMTENKAKEGVVETESGLQYKIIKQGEGDAPQVSDKVSVLYTGRLIDGTVFDTTSKNNTPRTFAVNRVVKGWTEGLQLMKPGAKFEFYIPPELGYGSQDRSSIPANSVLLFEVELVEIIESKPAEPKKQEEAKK